MKSNTTNNQVNDYIFLNALEINKSYRYRIEIKGADTAIILQKIIGCPSTQALKEAVVKNQIRNLPVTIDNIN